jgi:hypothetical protein
VLYAPGRDVASALRSAFSALRQIGAAVKGHVTEAGPTTITALRGGVRLHVEWSAQQQKASSEGDAIGRFAAALALPLLSTGQAEAFARAHSLCTHMTSLVLVDEAGEATEGFSRMTKVPLMASVSTSSGIFRRRADDTGLMQAASFSAPRMSSISRRLSPEALSRLQLSSNEESTVRFGRGLPETQADHSSQDKSPQKGMLKRSLDWLRGGNRLPDLMLFDGFAWDIHGDALIVVDLSALSIDQRRAVERLASRIQSAGVSATATAPAIDDACRLALGLIAHHSKGRTAERFARRVLKDAPQWALATTLEAVPITR